MQKKHLEAAQEALDQLRGQPRADFGFFQHDGRTIYSVTISRNGRHHYGTGPTLTDAYIASVENEPLPEAKPAKAA